MALSKVLKLGAMAAVSALALGSIVGCGGVMLRYDHNTGKGNQLVLLSYADSKDEVKESEAYKALKSDDIVAAVKALEDAVAKDPKNVMDRYRLGLLYQICDDFEQADKVLNEALELDKAAGGKNVDRIKHAIDNAKDLGGKTAKKDS